MQAAAENTYRRKSRRRGLNRAWSHYQFSAWKMDENGKRYAAPVLDDFDFNNPDPEAGVYTRETADLLNTAIYNKSSGNLTLMYMALDLDLKRCSKKWITGGKIDWDKIGPKLQAEHPVIYSAISSVVRSTSGKGLHIWIPISPLLMTDKYWTTQEYARSLQRYLQQFFDHYQMGVDFSASGLAREFANFFNTKKVVYTNDFARSRAHNNNRVSVIKEVMDYLGSLKFCGYQKKSDDQGLLYPHSGAETKLARLYLKLFEAWQIGDQVLMTQTDFIGLTGLSANTAKKFMRGENFLPWACIRQDEGRLWSFSFNPNSPRLFARAESLVLTGKAEKTTLDMSKQLVEPQLVQKGERNGWLARASVKLKWKGIDEDEAHDLMSELASLIPDSGVSRNCKQVKNIVRSIYRSQPYLGTFASRESMVLPDWLLNPQRTAIKILASNRQNFTEGVTGELPEQVLELRVSSVDQERALDTFESICVPAAESGVEAVPVREIKSCHKKDISGATPTLPGQGNLVRAGASKAAPDPEFSNSFPRVSDFCVSEDSPGAKTPPQTPFDFSIFSEYFSPVQLVLLQAQVECAAPEARRGLLNHVQALAQKARAKKPKKVVRPYKKNSNPLGSILARFGKSLE